MSYLIDRLHNDLVDLIFENRNNILLLRFFKTKNKINEYIDTLTLSQIIELEKEIKQILRLKSR